MIMNEPMAWVISVALVCATVIYIFRVIVNRLDAAGLPGPRC
jgi:hypothetical protein